MQEWLVHIRCRSAVHFERNNRALIETTSPDEQATKLLMTSTYSADGHAEWLNVYIRGCAVDHVDASKKLGQRGHKLIMAMGLLANAYIGDVQIKTVQTVRPDGKIWLYDALYGVAPSGCPPAYRICQMEPLLDVAKACGTHYLNQQFSVIVELYSEALRHASPGSRVLASNILFVAAERLGHVVRERLYTELDIQSRTPHDLAVELGIPEKKGGRKGARDLGQLDSYIRLKYIFEDDKELYLRLKAASDRFEHGKSPPSWRDELHDVFSETAALIRMAILRELALTDKTFGEASDDYYKKPLEGWVGEVLAPMSAEIKDPLDTWEVFESGLSLTSNPPIELPKAGEIDHTIGFKVDPDCDRSNVVDLKMGDPQYIGPMVKKNKTLNISINEKGEQNEDRDSNDADSSGIED